MRKYTKTSHPVLLFNKNLFQESSSKKHFGMNLDSKQNFEDHLKTIFTKVNKTIGLLWKLQKTLSRQLLLTTCKSLIRPHIDYSDVIFDQSYNGSFHQKLEIFKYNAALAITGVIRGTSKENLFSELGLG